MQEIAGTYGNFNWDEQLIPKKVDQTFEELNITWPDGSTRSLSIPTDVSKVTLPEIPEDFLRNVRGALPGGGGVNSRIAAGTIAKDAGVVNEIRYLDANRGDCLIKAELPPPTRWLELRESPKNYVLGNLNDKLIFRSPFEAAGPLNEKQFGDIAWLCEAQTILLNSPKDPEPVSAILGQRARSGFEVIFVLTPSLPTEFLKRVVLPEANVLIGSWDELQFLSGGSPVSITGAALAATRLRRMAPNAEIHVTMGKRGVLSMATGCNVLTHIELNPRGEVAFEVQRIAVERPAGLCGAGDSFAGGLLMARAFGLSLLSGACTFPPHVHAALAGCASALRWIGFQSSLTVASFLVRPVALPADTPWDCAA